MKLRDIPKLLKDVFQQYGEDKVARLAAALAYYTLFSLAPLLVIIIAIAGLVFGQQAAQNHIVNQISGLVGQSSATAIQAMIRGASQRGTSIFATVIGVIFLILGATGVFGQLQESLNTIWEVTPKPGRNVWSLLRERFLSFAMVLGIGFLLLVSLVLSAGLSALTGYVSGFLPGTGWVLQIVDFLVSFIIITVLFGMIFKFLPEAEIRWRDVWLGAIVTALLFTIGKFLIGLYLGRSSFSSSYGAAGSLLVVLLWIYYSGQILFIGAEFTQVYANEFGSHIQPEPDAINVVEGARSEEGITHQQTVQDVSRRGGGRQPTGTDPNLPRKQEERLMQRGKSGQAASPQKQASAGGSQPGQPQAIPATGQAVRYPDQALASENNPGRPRTPAEKGMLAFGSLITALIGTISGMVILGRTRK